VVGLIGVALLFVIAVWVVGAYNRLIGLRNRIRESWADVTTELRRRYDLIPNLVDTAKEYMRHEREIMDEVTRAREAAIAAASKPELQAQAEDELSRALKSLLAIAENYPDLKAGQNFLSLQRELANTEDRIQAARRFFNANVREMNNMVQYFPSSLVARAFRFQETEYFQVREERVTEPVRVGFGEE
jgi:LemA protein